MSASINIVMTDHEPKYVLYLYVDATNGALQDYKDKIAKHNERLETDPHPDSGFDLFVPEEQIMYVDRSNSIDFKIKCEMKRLDDNTQIMWELLIVDIVEISWVCLMLFIATASSNAVN